MQNPGLGCILRIRRKSNKYRAMATAFNKIISLNVAGLVSLPKRKRISRFLQKERPGVLCLQDRHLYEEENRYLRSIFHGTIFHAASKDRTKGVMVGITSNVPWVRYAATIDPEG